MSDDSATTMALDEIIDDFFFFRLTDTQRGIYRKRLSDAEVLATKIVSPPSFLIDFQNMWNTASVDTQNRQLIDTSKPAIN